MEPFHHIYYNNHFISAGFKVISNYESNKVNDVSWNEKQLHEFENKFIKQGAIFRNLDFKNLNSELYKIGKFSIESFSNNFLYTPISAEDFVSKYEVLERFFDPRLIQIVEDSDQKIHAFIFAIKDYLDPSGQTVIIKSLVRRPSTPFKGIGSHLVGKLLKTSSHLGFKKVIHAFMNSENAAAINLSKHHEIDRYKTYALYGLEV